MRRITKAALTLGATVSTAAALAAAAAAQIMVDPNQPLTIVLPGIGEDLSPGTVGQAYLPQDFFLNGGAAPYTWAVASAQLPPGLGLQTQPNPRDANNQLAGTPTTAGTFTFTMRVTNYYRHQATQQLTPHHQPLRSAAPGEARLVGAPGGAACPMRVDPWP